MENSFDPLLQQPLYKRPRALTRRRTGGSFRPNRQPARGRHSMNLFSRIWHSSLGKKYIMAVTGFALFFFVLGHMVGNLQVFLGPEAINRYGAFLQGLGELLWVVRIGLLIIVVLHIVSAIRLTAENRAARAVSYAEYRPVGSSYASRTMMMSGLIIAAFIIYHLLHFTVQNQAINLTGKNFLELHDEKGRHDVFAMMITGFRQPIVSLFYIVAMALLCLHLSHGVSSMFQSMGWKKNYYKPLLDKGARLIAILIFAGYVSIPIAILMGYGKSYLERPHVAVPMELAPVGGAR
jgi:succinate dehydrogenase / fumarate reductase, cytochrome b subunit